MVWKRVKEPLPGFTGLCSHRIVYRDVGEGVPYRRPSMRPCLFVTVLVAVLVAYVFKSF